MVAENGTTNFNIFFISKESKSIPCKNPYTLKGEIKSLNNNAINNLRCTHLGAILIRTHDVDCTIEICNITNFLCAQVQATVIL